MATVETKPQCPICGKGDLTRIISNVAIHKSTQASDAESCEQVAPQDYYKDPRNIGRHLEKRMKEMNVELPPEIRSSINEARDGNLPDSLKDLNSAAADTAYH